MNDSEKATPGRTRSARTPSAREEALRRLLRIEEEGAYIGLEGSDGGELDSREMRQSTEYVAGVTRWRRRLDFILSQFYRGNYESVEPALKQVLRIGLYDILYLQTPSYAAVSEAVDLAKRKIRRGAGGLVNGVLRSIIRAADELPEPDTGDFADDLAVRTSHPTWMVRRWLDRYGQADTESLLEWNNTRPVFGVRINTQRMPVERFTSRLDELGVEWEPGRHLPYFVRVASVQPLLEARLLEEGYCAIQDEGAGLLVALLDPQPGETVLDVCAAPGGKALHAAQRMRESGRILAVDVHGGRLRLAERAAREHRVGIIETRVSDVRALRPGDITADRVLVDAPCSGTGVLSKRADLRWKRSPEDLTDLVKLQDEILDAAARLVAPGGVLVYGTCSLEPEENVRRVEAFMERHPEFQLEDAADFLPAELIKNGYYASFPPRDSIDGAFGARFRAPV